MLATAGPFPVLVLGRALTGLGHTLATIGGLAALLRDEQGPSASVRLNLYEFAGMLGVLGGLAGVGMLPARWGWPVSMLIISIPLLVPIGLTPLMLRRFADRPRRAPAPSAAAPPGSWSRTRPIVWLMFAVGALMGLSWSAVSQFLIPLRGTREFGVDRGGVSGLLALSQLVDLAVLLPLGWLADRAGRALALGLVLAALGFGVWAAGLGSYPYFVAGCVLLGVGMAGWMFPLGVIREHIEPHTVAWRMGLYRAGVDASTFAGPLICGLLGEGHTGLFIGAMGLAALAAGARLIWRGLA